MWSEYSFLRFFFYIYPPPFDRFHWNGMALSGKKSESLFEVTGCTSFYNCVKPSVNLLYFGVSCCCFFARLIPWSGYRRSKDHEYQGTVVLLNIGFIRSLLKTTHSPDWEEQNLLCLVHKYRTKHFQCMVNVLYNCLYTLLRHLSFLAASHFKSFQNAKMVKLAGTHREMTNKNEV